MRTIILVGSPNVGKSALFNQLTGTYSATVSNYPGTTVDVTRAQAVIGGETFSVVDTPGMYSLVPLSEEERVARSIMLGEHPSVVVHVIDSRNLERMLSFTLQLIEAGLPVIVVLNMSDEAQKTGIVIDRVLLAKTLNVPVVETVSTTGKGIDILRGEIEAYVRSIS
ncbi:MAG TPA: FeoB small GTPase domain-containing protein [Candidatus Omnitrophota bacterium]|nr:FeoB small GTPase domain-containing protein [Candidatus Omnitrophota bacterium]HPT07888.1 FeoB small GTPase domain-containing protein [Candidatus Omnitrophota bacterium]